MMRLVSMRRPSVATQKIAQDLQAGVAGFFRVKLHAHHIAALDGRGERLDILRDRPRCRP